MHGNCKRNDGVVVMCLGCQEMSERLVQRREGMANNLSERCSVL